MYSAFGIEHGEFSKSLSSALSRSSKIRRQIRTDKKLYKANAKNIKRQGVQLRQVNYPEGSPSA